LRFAKFCHIRRPGTRKIWLRQDFQGIADASHMMHVKQIKEIIADGRTEDAHSALEELLVLGPKNTEALKLRASLYAMEGRFTDEGRIWQRIAEIDNEDPDAITYYTQRQLEDREHFYFTDDLAGGGRKFLAYPRKLVNASVIGLFGCVAFLLASRAALSYPQLSDPYVMLGLFTLLVALPWVGLLATYFRSLRSVSVTSKGIALASRMTTRQISWSEVEKLALVRIGNPEDPGLTLIVVPKKSDDPLLSIDLSQSSTCIRARSHFVRELSRMFAEPEYLNWDALGAGSRKVHSY
jgi:hypothetical protein